MHWPGDNECSGGARAGFSSDTVVTVGDMQVLVLHCHCTVLYCTVLYMIDNNDDRVPS